MKKYMIALAACVCALNASAQWGIQAGANFTNLKLSDVSMSKDMFSKATGYTVGLSYDFDLLGGFGVNTGLMFIQRNVTHDGFLFTGEETSLNRYSSLELPLNLKYTLDLPLVKPFIIAGPYLDCGLWAKQDGKKLKYGDKLERFTWGMTLGAGVDVFKHLRVMYQYDWGLTSLTIKEASSNITTKPRSQRITLGILF